jgi:hypothetical protein
MVGLNVHGARHCLDGFRNEDNPGQTRDDALSDGEGFIGVFPPSGPVDRLVIVEPASAVNPLRGDAGNRKVTCCSIH